MGVGSRSDERLGIWCCRSSPCLASALLAERAPVASPSRLLADQLLRRPGALLGYPLRVRRGDTAADCVISAFPIRLDPETLCAGSADDHVLGRRASRRARGPSDRSSPTRAGAASARCRASGRAPISWSGPQRGALGIYARVRGTASSSSTSARQRGRSPGHSRSRSRGGSRGRSDPGLTPRRSQADRQPTNTTCDASSSSGCGAVDGRLEPGLLEQVEPRVLGKQPFDVVVVDDPRRLARLAHDDRVVDLVRRVARVVVDRPLEVAQRAPVRAVVAAVRGAGRERLAREVGHEQRHAARARVRESRADAVAEVALGRHVRDRVVDEDGVERPPEAQRAHVAEHVLALGIQLPAQRQHLRGEVGQRAREASLQVRGVVAAARAQLEQRLRLRQGLEDQPLVTGCLDRVVLGGGEQMEPGRKVAVQAHATIIPIAGRRRRWRRRPRAPRSGGQRAT